MPLPKITSGTLNAYKELFSYIIKTNDEVYTIGQGITQNITTMTQQKYGAILELKIEELQLKPLELQRMYWISIMTTEPLQINQYVSYKNRTFNIKNEFKASNFFIYHCCEEKNI